MGRAAMATVEFRCDVSQQGTELLHCWEHTVGSCHAPLALRADWQQQLRRCRSELGFRYVRFHGLLSDDVGTVVTHNGIGAHIHCSAHLRMQTTVYQLNLHFPPSLVPSWSS